MEVADLFHFHSDKSTAVFTSVTTATIRDLSFLNDRERAIILKVIKADQELRRSTLGYLKKVVEAGRQLQLAQKFTEDFQNKCSCCGKGFLTITGKRNSLPYLQCQQCKHSICKQCGRIQNGEVICIICFKEKLYKLQSVDYLPVFHREEVSSEKEESADDVVVDNDTAVQPLYGSELLKKSLEVTRKRNMFANKEGSVNKAASLSLELSLNQEKEETRKQPVKPTYSTSISDPNSGFKLIKEMKAEEDLVDLCSLYSEPCDPIDYKISGKIMFGVWYQTKEEIFYVRISKLEKLLGIKDGTADPYVKTYLLPGKSKLLKRRTAIHRRTTKPEINELLKYGNISEVEIREKTLWVSVWNWDRYGRNQFLGEVHLPLSSIDLTDSIDKWYDLKDKAAEDEIDFHETRGRILVSIKYDPNTTTNEFGIGVTETFGKLLIQVQKAEKLMPEDTTTSINPFARCYLLPNRCIDSKRKSRVLSNTVSPVWNSEIMFHHITQEELESSRVLEITVWDEDRRGVNQFIGGIRLGPDPLTSMDAEWMDSVGDEVTQWEEMLANPGEWVEQWHYLRPTMDSLHNAETKEEETPKPSIGDTASVENSDEDDSSDSSISSRESSPELNMPEILPKSSLSYSKSFLSKKPRKGSYTISGEILVNIEYKNGEIIAYIDRAVGIAAANSDGTSDSYVKTYLLPNRKKSSKRKSDVQKRTNDPLYDATFKYKVPFEQLGTRALWLTVWNVGKFGHRFFLGEVCIPLSSLNLKQPTEKWYKLNDVKETEIPGHVAPTAPVHIEEDLLAREPLAYRSRTSAVTSGSIRSLSGSPAQSSRNLLETKSSSLERPVSHGMKVPKGLRSRSASPPNITKHGSSVSLDQSFPIHNEKDDFRSKSESPPGVTKHDSSVSLDQSFPIHNEKDDFRSKSESPPGVTKHDSSASLDHDIPIHSEKDDFPFKSASPPDATKHSSSASLDHDSPIHSEKDDFRSKSASPQDFRKCDSPSVSPDLSHSVGSDKDMFPAHDQFFEVKTNTNPNIATNVLNTAADSFEELRSKSASPPDVSVSPPSPISPLPSEDVFPDTPPPRKRTSVISGRPIKSEHRWKSASASNVSVNQSASSLPYGSEEDLFSTGRPHRIRSTVTITRGSRSLKSAIPHDLHMSYPPKIVVEDSESNKAESSADLFGGFTSYHKP